MDVNIPSLLGQVAQNKNELKTAVENCQTTNQDKMTALVKVNVENYEKLSQILQNKDSYNLSDHDIALIEKNVRSISKNVLRASQTSLLFENRVINKQLDVLSAKPNDKTTRSELIKLVRQAENVREQFIENVNAVSQAYVARAEVLMLPKEINDITNLINDANILLFSLKKAKHEEEAASITGLPEKDQGRALHSAFVRGDAKTVGSFVKLGQEESAKVRGVEGKTPSIKLAELNSVFSSLINDFENTHVEIKTNPTDEPNLESVIFTTADGQKITLLAEDLQGIDLSQITVTDADLNKYQEAMVNGERFLKAQVSPEKAKIPTEEFFQKRETEKNLDGSMLHYSHKLALNVYSGPGYTFINSTLRGSQATMLGEDKYKGDKNLAFKEGFLHGIVALNGMEKLPSCKAQSIFRGETRAFRELKIIDKYKQAVDDEKGYVLNKAFFSAARERPVESFISLSRITAAVIVKNSNGKDITAWSQYEGEREVLTAPSPLKIDKYKDVEVNGKKITFFVARPVNVDLSQPVIREDSMKTALQMKKFREDIAAAALQVPPSEPPSLSERFFTRMSEWFS